MDGDSFTSLGRTPEDGGNQRSDSLVNLYTCVFCLCYALMPSTHVMLHSFVLFSKCVVFFLRL